MMGIRRISATNRYLIRRLPVFSAHPLLSISLIPTPTEPDSWQACPADYSPIARVHEDLDALLGLGYTTERRMGVLQPDKSTPPNAISDGTSHTILLPR